jgi:hypothetical protein
VRASILSNGIGGADVATGARPEEKYKYTSAGTAISPRISPKMNFFINFLLYAPPKILTHALGGSRKTTQQGEVSIGSDLIAGH